MATKKPAKSTGKPRASAKPKSSGTSKAAAENNMRLTVLVAIFAALCVAFAALVVIQYGW